MTNPFAKNCASDLDCKDRCVLPIYEYSVKRIIIIKDYKSLTENLMNLQEWMNLFKSLGIEVVFYSSKFRHVELKRIAVEIEYNPKILSGGFKKDIYRG